MKSLLLVSVAILAFPATAQASVAERYGWTPQTIVAPAAPAARGRAALGKTLPHYHATIVSPLTGKTYPFDMLGTDPRHKKIATTISVVPIAVRLHFPNGVVLDATKPGCNDSVSVSDRFYNSPLFSPVPFVSNGVNVGNTQYLDAFQRAEFWQYVAGSNYHVLLANAAPVRTIDVTAPSGSTTTTGACSGSNHDLGQVDVNAYDALIQQIDRQYAKPDQLPIVLTYNVVETEGGCCILGYHSEFPVAGGTQVYATASYTDAGVFGAPVEDLDSWSRVLGDTFDNPFVRNATPAWSQGGQTGCTSSSLEVGEAPGLADPTVNAHGFAYHVHELAFYSWFFRTPSTGTGGLYSFAGSLKTVQGLCA